MKKFIPIILSVLFVLMFTGCNTYKVPENCCIVGLSDEFQLYSESEGKLCEPIDKKIKGAYEKYDTNYYSIIKGADYIILVDGFVDDAAGYGWEIKGGNPFSSAYWQGYIITQFEKVYDDKLNLENEVFYTTNYSQVNDNVPVIFDKNCTVKAVKEPYLYVGGIFEVVPKGSDILDNKIDEYLTENGILGERDGFYYLLLEDEVCVHKDAWKTNLEVTDYKYENLEDGLWNAISAQFTTNAPDVSENEELCLYTICRTYSGKYFVYPLVLIDAEGFGMPVREHELKLIFN